MRLLIDTVSNPAAAVVFDDARQAVLIKRESIAGKEYERFLDWISETCRAAGVDLDKLKGIACVR